MKPRSAFFSRPRQKGFTLLEILVAILIFGIVMATIFGSFNTVFSNSAKLSQANADDEIAAGCFARITADLASIYVPQPPYFKPPGINDPPTAYRVVLDTFSAGGQEFPRLRFTSLAHTPLNGDQRTGIAEIVYYVMADDDHMVLKRADTLFPYHDFEARSTDPVLCPHITALTIELYDAEGEVHDAWDSDSPDFGRATPQAVHLALAMGSGDDARKFETTVKLQVYRDRERP